MPLKAISYDKTHFYKIVCKDTDIQDCYVGHTTDFTSRKYIHKRDCNNKQRKGYNRPLHQFIREKGGWDNFDMVLIDTLKCENSLDARKMERTFIESLNASLNVHKAFSSKEETRERTKQWHKDNPEKHNATARKCYDKLKKEDPDRFKKYHATQEEKNKVKVECVCGSVHRKGDTSRHLKSIKHQQYLQNQTNPQE